MLKLTPKAVCHPVAALSRLVLTQVLLGSIFQLSLGTLLPLYPHHASL